MKYFIDTEFIEGFHKPLFGKRRHFIDLISIGIYAEDGREYYAISNEYDYNDASDWVKENVIIPMYTKEISGDKRNHINAETFHKYIPNGKSNKEIALDIIDFVNPISSALAAKAGVLSFSHMDKPEYWISEHNGVRSDGKYRPRNSVFPRNPQWVAQPEFYGYYADYDWVLFCSLFGRMIDLPKGFPMYCHDLKQTFDEDYPQSTRERVKQQPDYPKQQNEHNALADAKWNKRLYAFLQAN